MTPEQITQWASEAGVYIRGHYDETGSTLAELQAFAKLVRQHALEETAAVCVNIATKHSNVVLGVAIDCAAEIRSMKS
jgi:hypothetical protein